jgi:DNA-binding FadR family transcriptional regulator
MKKTTRTVQQPEVEKKTSMVEKIALTLRKEIISDDSLAGSSLSEKKLSLRFGASNHTIRGALQTLAREGLVVISHGRATKVKDYRTSVGLDVFPDLLITCPEIITADVFSAYYQYILWFYDKIIIAATRKAKPFHKKKLMKIVSAFKDDMTGEEYWENHTLFFRELLKIGDNVLLMMFHNSHVRIRRRLGELGFMRELTLPPTYHKETREQLVEAICANDEKQALEVARNYRDSTEKSVERTFKKANIFL